MRQRLRATLGPVCRRSSKAGVAPSRAASISRRVCFKSASGSSANAIAATPALSTSSSAHKVSIALALRTRISRPGSKPNPAKPGP